MAQTQGNNDGGAQDLAVAIARLAGERNCEDIVVLDVRETSSVTGYFVIATGTSDRQIRAVCDEIQREAATIGEKVWRVAGRDAGDWVVMDFVDVVVHLFSRPLREYYDLELIWGEAPRVDVPGVTAVPAESE
ncbi:MAG: ribosome silencing factor [Planctomycetes bacterium]|nr:ribosome silencing factor [Planctomycetota bacterium]